MTADSTRETVVIVTARSASDLEAALQEETPFDVTTIAPAEAIEQAVASTRVKGVVLELDGPDLVRETLARIDESSALPVVVAPQDGSERLASVAVRAGASDYVPSARAGCSSARAEDVVARLVDVTEPTDGLAETDVSFHRIVANALPDEAFVLDADGVYLDAKVRPDSGELYTLSPDELIGRRLTEAFSEELAAEMQACLDRTLASDEVQSIEYAAETTDGRRRFEARVVPIDGRIDGRRAVVWLARDVTRRVQRERELRSRREELETIDRINTAVLRVIEALVDAATRGDIERELCEQLVESNLYRGAWIVEPAGEGSVAYRTGAGEPEAELDEAEAALERTHEIVAEEGLIERAMETETIQISNHLTTDDTIPTELQTAARTQGIESATAVPLRHDQVTYGVLVVVAQRSDAFGEREEAGFRLLGETVGFVINAVKNRRLLLADSVVELELCFDGGDSFLVDLTAHHDCTCSMEWAGTTADGTIFQYVTIRGLDAESVLEDASSHGSVDQCRLVHEGDGRSTIELRLSESAVRTLVSYGATIRELQVEDGVGTCVVEVPQDVNVRRIVDALAGVYERTELVARREVDRSVQTAAERRNRIRERLTDKQLTTLRLAYYSGYFDWPRESTGEEIAGALDVSPPTMHQHLRRALDELLSEFFDERR